MNLYGHSLTHQNPCPRGHEIYNLSRLFIGHHYNILSFSDLGLENKIFKEIMHFHYITKNIFFRK